MTIRKILGTVIILIWLMTLAFISGPARWELAHTYQHLIEDMAESMPLLTSVVGLPILGIEQGRPGSVVVRVLFWGFTWLGPLIRLVGIWRAKARDVLSDWLLYGGTIYCSIMVLLALVIAVSLWIPFGFL